MTFARGAALHAISLADCRDRVVGKARPSKPLSVPDVSVRGRSLWLRAGGRLVRLTAPVPPNPAVGPQPEPVSVSPDDRWLVWVDAVHSGSISADGWPFSVTRLAPGGRTFPLARSMLEYPDYLTWCGSALVYTAGGDRVATHTKRLLVARPPNWRPRPLWNAPARAFGVREQQGYGQLYVLRGGRVAGPVAWLGYSSGFYGHHDWPYRPAK